MHVLLLTDRDWTHPQGGGTGTNLYGQVSRWIAWGHRVTVIAGAYPGCEAVSRPHERLEIHRMGSRLTVFPRAALATRRGVGADADVVLEVVNGIAFFTPAVVVAERAGASRSSTTSTRTTTSPSSACAGRWRRSCSSACRWRSSTASGRS